MENKFTIFKKMSKTISLPDPDGRYLWRYASEGSGEAPLKQVLDALGHLKIWHQKMFHLFTSRQPEGEDHDDEDEDDDFSEIMHRW